MTQSSGSTRSAFVTQTVSLRALQMPFIQRKLTVCATNQGTTKVWKSVSDFLFAMCALNCEFSSSQNLAHSSKADSKYHLKTRLTHRKSHVSLRIRPFLHSIECRIQVNPPGDTLDSTRGRTQKDPA